MPAFLTPWFAWLTLAVGGGLVYQLGMKVVSSKLPLSVYCRTCSVVLFIAGLFLLKLHPQKITLSFKDTTGLIVIACVALSVVAIDVGYFNMYKAGAPVSVSRTVASAVLNRFTLRPPHSPRSVEITMMPIRLTSRSTMNGCRYSGLALARCPITWRIFSAYGRDAAMRVCTLRILLAATISMALVIFCVLRMLLICVRISFAPAMN